MVTQKAIEDAIRAGPRVPDHIDLAHHNAVAGKDLWRNVSTLISAGRTLPPPEAVEAIAMALSGKWLDPACLPADGKDDNGRPRRWYAAASHPVTDRKGNTVTLMREHHPHPLAEAARAAICEDEIVQIIGRCRGVNREESNPVTVHILADLPLPMAVDEFRQWDPPGLDAAMLAEGAWSESCEDAARWWPEIIRNAKALKDARHQRSVEFSYNILQYENSTHLTRLSYQKPGLGRRPVAAVFDRRLIPDPVQWLRERLGPLKVQLLDADAVVTRKTRRKAVPPPPDVVEIEAPAPEAQPEAVEISTPEAQPQPYEGGILPAPMAVQVQRRLRELGYRHADAAEAVGISRQQFTNVMNRRFGLSRDAAARLTAFMNRPPDVPTQPDFNL